jgi:hypothetical protein
MIALQSVLIKNKSWTKGVKMADFLSTVHNYPETVLPHYRKQRAYLNQAIARNEIDGREDISKKLFLRVSRGYYVLNPELEILINEDWVNVYDLMGAEKVGKFDEEESIRLMREKMFREFPEMRDITNSRLTKKKKNLF